MTTPSAPPFRFRHLRHPLAVGLAFVALTGCTDKGIKKTMVRGTVSHQGQPVRSGVLKFIGPKGAFAIGTIQSDGTYTVTDIVPGETKVGVEETGPQGPIGTDPGLPGTAAPDTKPAAPPPPPPPLAVPVKYRDPSKSGLVYTITADTKTLDIVIK